MKKTYAIFLLLIMFISAHSQLTHTKWKGRITVQTTVGVVFDFGKDTCSIYTIADSTFIESMAYTEKDSVITLQKIEGQSDCDNSTIGKYKAYIKDDILYFHMVSDDCDDRSTVIDNTKWAPWHIPVEVALDEAILKQYVGTYQIESLHPINITLEGGHLQMEGPNNNLPKSPLIAETSTKFFLRIAGVEFDFVKAADGSVVSFISHEEKDYELKKVK